MKLTRRNFLATAPAVVGTVLMGNKFAFARFAGAPLGDADALSRLGWKSFVPHVGTIFSFYDESGREFEFRLDRMDDCRTTSQRRGPGECFSLMFSCSESCQLEQGTYDVKHNSLGGFRLLVTVQHSMNRRKKYEAIINRISE